MLKKQYKRIQLADSSPEWNISECGSSDEERWTSGRRRAPESPLHIENCSSDEENDRLFNSSLHNNNASTPLYGQRKTPLAVRKRLPLSVTKRKRKHVAADESPNSRRILSNRNSDLEESPRKSSSHRIPSRTPTSVYSSSTAALSPEKCVTPWRNVRKVFAPLRTPTSSSILGATQRNNNDAEEPPTTANLDETRIDWSSSSSSEAGSPIRPGKSQSGTQADTQKSSAPTELEMLVALIERESNTENQAGTTLLKQNQRNRFKRCRKDGCVAQLQRALASAHADQMFLAHDQQLGLQHGALLRVLRLDEEFGVHLATVQLQGVAAEGQSEATNQFRVVVAADMACRLQIGSEIMAFFDVNVEPYEVQGERIYVQPHKLWYCK